MQDEGAPAFPCPKSQRVTRANPDANTVEEGTGDAQAPVTPKAQLHLKPKATSHYADTAEEGTGDKQAPVTPKA